MTRKSSGFAIAATACAAPSALLISGRSNWEQGMFQDRQWYEKRQKCMGNAVNGAMSIQAESDAGRLQTAATRTGAGGRPFGGRVLLGPSGRLEKHDGPGQGMFRQPEAAIGTQFPGRPGGRARRTLPSAVHAGHGQAG